MPRKKKPAPKPDGPGDFAKTCVEALAAGKQGYKIADDQLDAVLAECREGKCPTCGALRFKNNGVVKSADGRTFQIVDKLANEDSVGVGQKFRRYEIREVPA